jgi:hypothetical protein
MSLFLLSLASHTTALVSSTVEVTNQPARIGGFAVIVLFRVLPRFDTPVPLRFPPYSSCWSSRHSNSEVAVRSLQVALMTVHSISVGQGPQSPSMPSIPFVSGRLVACYLANMIGLGGVSVPFLFMYCGRVFSCVLLVATGGVTAYVLLQQAKVVAQFPNPLDCQLDQQSTEQTSFSSSSSNGPSSTSTNASNGVTPLDEKAKLNESREQESQNEALWSVDTTPLLATCSEPTGKGKDVELVSNSETSIEAGGWSFNLLATKGLHRCAAVGLDLSVTASVLLAIAYFLKVVVQCLISAGAQLHNGDYQANGGWAASTEFLTVCVGCVTSLLSLRPRMLDHHIFSVVAAAAIVGILLVLVIILVVDGATNDPAPLWINWESPTQILQCLPIFVAAFSTSYNSPTIIAEDVRRWQSSQSVLRAAQNESIMKSGKETDDSADGGKDDNLVVNSTPYVPVGDSCASLLSTPPPGYWSMISRSIVTSLVLVTLINIFAGLLGTAAVSSAALTKGGGNLLSSLPMTHVNHGGAVCVLIIILRFLVAVHVCTVFPVYATTGRQALLRVIYPRGKYLRILQWILNVAFTASAIALSLHSPTVGLLIGLNCAIFAPAIALAVPIITAYRIRARAAANSLSSRIPSENNKPLTSLLVGSTAITLYSVLCSVAALYFWIRSVE